MSKLSADGLEELGRLLREDGRVRFAYLFGSHARGDAGPTSDVDLALFLDPAAVGPESTGELMVAAVRLLGVDAIDLVILNRAALPLCYRVVQQGRVLSDRAHAERVAFESRILRMGWDFLPREREMLRRRFGLDAR